MESTVIAESFRFALHAGLGRALLHIRARGIAGLEDALIESCIRNTAYDPQCEYDRAEWILHIIDSADAAALIAPHIIRELPRTENTWDFQHLATLAAALARRGFQDARTALYAAFDAQRVREEWAGGQQIIELDGADGLLHVARRIGKRLLAEPDYRMGDALTLPAEKHLGANEPRRLLEQAAREDVQIAAFFRQLYPVPPAAAPSDAKPREKRRRSPLKRVTFEQVASALADPGGNAHLVSMIRLWDWGRLAPESEVRMAAAALRADDDPTRLRGLLQIFAKRPIPDFDPELLPLLDHADEGVRRAARAAFQQSTHPAIRQEALARLGRQPPDYIGLDLLQSNVEPGDGLRVLAILPSSGNPYALHEAVFPLVSIYEKSPLSDATEPLLWAWNHSPCSICRSSALKTLHKLAPLPQWLAAEAAHDANEDIRDFISNVSGPAEP